MVQVVRHHGLCFLVLAAFVAGRTVTFDDPDHENLSYAGSWVPEYPNPGWPGVTSNTLTSTKSPKARVTLQFKGTAIAFRTLASPISSNFTVKLDGKDYGPFNAFNETTAQATLFSVDGLDPSVFHTLMVAKRLDDPGWVGQGNVNSSNFYVDEFVVTTHEDADPPAMTTSPNPTAGNATGSTSGSASSNTTAIIGGVIGGIVAVTLVAAILFFKLRRNPLSLQPLQEGTRAMAPAGGRPPLCTITPYPFSAGLPPDRKQPLQPTSTSTSEGTNTFPRSGPGPTGGSEDALLRAQLLDLQIQVRELRESGSVSQPPPPGYTTEMEPA